jgi:prophage tail gpP-like protein
MKTQGISVLFDGTEFSEWTSAEVSRDMKDLSGKFNFTIRDDTRNVASLEFATTDAAVDIEPGATAEIYVDGQLCLVGYVDSVEPDIDHEHAEVRISGRDKTGDLVDCAAMKDGPAEFNNVKLEDAVKRVVAPYGLSVRSEVDTGEPFTRYSLDLSETAFSAVEKGTRSRRVLILSDGVGGVVITRTGSTRAPDGLTLPGNVKSSKGKKSFEKRHSETIVRGQAEKTGKERKGDAPLDATADPVSPGDRTATDGSATETERKGTVATGRAIDPEITRYRPIVHLARSKADGQSAQDEADWRMRTARGESEELTYSVNNHSANGSLWRVNEITTVCDAFQKVNRDMLISNVAFREDESGRETELKVVSPEAFDTSKTGAQRSNATSKSKSLDSTAEAL